VRWQTRSNQADLRINNRDKCRDFNAESRLPKCLVEFRGLLFDSLQSSTLDKNVEMRAGAIPIGVVGFKHGGGSKSTETVVETVELFKIEKRSVGMGVNWGLELNDTYSQLVRSNCFDGKLGTVKKPQDLGNPLLTAVSISEDFKGSWLCGYEAEEIKFDLKTTGRTFEYVQVSEKRNWPIWGKYKLHTLRWAPEHAPGKFELVIKLT
jgi:hypothetical protein